MAENALIIGAGISGISCAITLINKGFVGQITIIEQGASHKERLCSVDSMGICTNCSPCKTISGFGGSVHYGDTVKLSCFPSGKRLINTLGGSRSEEFQSLALSYFSDDVLKFITPSKENSLFIEKEYPISILHSKKAKGILDEWCLKLSNKPNVKVLFNCEVTNIEKQNNTFSVSYKEKREHKEIYADTVVLCMGRAGFRKMKQFAREINIVSKPPQVSIGFRFMMPNYILQEVCNIHPDFKTSLNHNGYKYKTFCFSAGDIGGRIKHANHGGFMLIDGHSITDDETPSPLSNFAILSQLRDSSGNFYDYDWIENNVILPYIELNTTHKGKPVLQSYNDFKVGKVTKLSNEHLAKFNSQIYGVGNLASLIPSKEQHIGFCNSLEELITEFCRISEIKEPLSNVLAQISVLGLELESLWDEIELSQDMETNIPSLFVTGDSTGIAQGILQASVGGIAAAYGILKDSL